MRLRKLLTKMGVFLVELTKADQPGKGKLELQQEIHALSTGRKTAVREYYVKKAEIFLIVVIVGILFAGIAWGVEFFDPKDYTTESIQRPGYGEGDKREALQVQVEGAEQAKAMEITVQSRKYTDIQQKALLDEAVSELDKVLLGENDSLDEVRKNLYFPDQLKDGAVKVSWTTTPYGVIEQDGSIKNVDEEEGTLVEIQGLLTCGTSEEEYLVFARVLPPVLSDDEALKHSISKEVEAADVRDRTDEMLTLPSEAAGKRLIWSRPKSSIFPIILFLTILTAIGVYYEMDSQMHQKAEDRKNQLMMDYPDLMWKMTMLLGAGLNIKGVFSRISEEYLRELKARSDKDQRKSSKKRYVYEEVTYTCFEMQSGISEAQAYERFGRRCQLPEYIRLGSVLSQNLKKGAKGLTTLLESEAVSSMNDRKNHARKMGERAGTKLLLPMVLMLGIVLVILMVPAFLSF